MNAEELLDTREGLALANAAYQEGVSATLRALNAHESGNPWATPVSPYSAPLLAMIAASRKNATPEPSD